MSEQVASGDLPTRVRVEPTELGRKELNAFWPYWLRRMLLASQYQPSPAVELYGKHVLVSGDTDVDRLWHRVRVQAERICPLQPALQWQASGYKHLIEWRVPTVDAYRAIRSDLTRRLERLPKSVRIGFDPPFGPLKYQALLRVVNTKPGTKVRMAEVRQEVELEAALLLRASA